MTNNVFVDFLHYLPDFKGKRRIGRVLLRNMLKKKDVIIRGMWGLKFKVPNFVETIGFELLINGIYEKETFDLINSKVLQNGTILDIGANIGAITIPISYSRKDIKVISIEASPRVFHYLSDNLKLNKITNCLLFNNAVSDRDGEIVRFFSPKDLFGKGSMSSVFTDEAENIDTISIDSLLLKNSIRGVDFIKIDIEGYEYYAFMGAKGLLSGLKSPDILFEFVDWAEASAKNLDAGQAQELLQSFGYSIYEVVNGKPIEPMLTDPVRQGSVMLFATKNKLTS
jgi:FkbM family methyltransferase